jgi:hypothetical protein
MMFNPSLRSCRRASAPGTGRGRRLWADRAGPSVLVSTRCRTFTSATTPTVCSETYCVPSVDIHNPRCLKRRLEHLNSRLKTILHLFTRLFTHYLLLSIFLPVSLLLSLPASHLPLPSSHRSLSLFLLRRLGRSHHARPSRDIPSAATPSPLSPHHARTRRPHPRPASLFRRY